MKQKYILFILFAFISLKGNSQNNYSVTAIPFQPFSGSLTPLATGDELYSGVINLPFSFDFYGTTYNQIVISTNGYIDFRTSLAGMFSQWSFNQTIPNASFPIKNSILGCYEDLYNNEGTGTLTYGTYGVAPFRKFVVYFNNQTHFQGTPTQLTSFQMIMNESANAIDVQMITRTPTPNWQGGRGVIGLINLDGTRGIAAPGRNTGNWTASQEAWRFYRDGYFPNYSFVRCGDVSTGIQVFNLAVAAGDLYSSNPSIVSFYETMVNAQANVNAISNTASYSNLSNPQTIYANIGGIVKPIVLSVVDCNIDFDNDNAASEIEDVNGDSNLANDDTDFDGMPNYLDNDDDGDLVLTNVEYVFAKTNITLGGNILLDTDHDGIPNYLDNDDDGDNLLTFLEDYNRNGNPSDDDTNSSGTADYLEFSVALGTNPVFLLSDVIKVYPNPASDVLNIQNNTDDVNASIEVYSINGSKVKSLKATEALTTISVSDLQAGVYLIKVIMNNQVGNYKFIKD